MAPFSRLINRFDFFKNRFCPPAINYRTNLRFDPGGKPIVIFFDLVRLLHQYDSAGSKKKVGKRSEDPDSIQRKSGINLRNENF